jgi:hypothetical protein
MCTLWCNNIQIPFLPFVIVVKKKLKKKKKNQNTSTVEHHIQVNFCFIFKHFLFI